MRASLIEQAVREARPVLSDWYSDEMLRENLANEIDSDLAEGAMRIIELSGGRIAVVQVPAAHETGAMLRTFVRYRNFGITSADEIDAIDREVRRALKPLDVDRLLLFMHGEPLHGVAVVDYLVAGLIDKVRPPGDASIANLRLVTPESMAFYEQYRAWYEEFWQRRPHLCDVWVEKREDIEDCLNQSGVRLIYLREERCGMLAAQRRVEYGLRGWRMRERVTAPARWGQGISTAAFVPFAQSLNHDEKDAIWGNILPSNTSSLSSALRLGRRIVGTYYEAPRHHSRAQ